MEKIKMGKSWFHSGAILAALTIFCLAGCGGGGTPAASTTPASATTTIYFTGTPAQPNINLSSIAAEASAAASAPYLSGTTVQHYCDCVNTHAVTSAAGCIAGNDTTGNGTDAFPYQSLAKAAQWLNGQTSGIHTVALCQGGVWDAPTPAGGSPSMTLTSNTYCPVGQTCSEFREYASTQFAGGGAKPVIYNSTAASSYVFSLGSGQRIMNLSLYGSGTGAVSSDQKGFFMYLNGATGPNTGIHDDTIWNVDMSGFDIAIHDAQPFDYNMTIKGNHISNSTGQAYLGESSNLTVSYNYFHNNGSSVATDHTLYFGGNYPVTGVNVVGNYMDGFWTGGGATSCAGGALTIHGEFTNLVVSGNTIVQDPTKVANTCWGISATNGAYHVGTYVRNALFSDNVVVNGGNAGIVVDNCPYCVIENNLVIQDNSSNGGLGIAVASQAQRATPNAPVDTAALALGAVSSDDPSTNYTVRNNTIYFTANANSGMEAGIKVGLASSTEIQTGHNIYNNTISYLASSAALNGAYCFNYPLPLSAYATINNNNCYSAYTTAYAWERTTNTSRAAWIAYAAGQGHSFDSTNSNTTNPAFTLAASPYITWTDGSYGYTLFNSGGNSFTATGRAALSGQGTTGPTADITGAARPPAPAIGAYE